MEPNRIVIYSSLNLIDVHLVRSALTREGIASYMRAQYLGPLAGEVPFDAARTELYVDAVDERQAMAVIRAAFLVEGADRICRHCQEPNPVSFEICWNCQTDLA